MSLQWILCFLVVASSICRSKGLGIAPSPDGYLSSPQIRDKASIPAGVAKPAEINAPPSPASSPKETSPATASQAAPSSIPPAIPLSNPPSSSHNFTLKEKWPRNSSPSIDIEPIGPSASDVPSPYYSTPPTRSNFHEETPSTGSPIISSHAPAPARISKPTLPHPKAIAPPVAPAPNAIPFHEGYGPVVPPTLSGSSTGHGKSYGAPITAPPRDAAEHLSPVNRSYSKALPSGSSPMSSPPREEGTKHPVVAHAPPAESPSISPTSPLHLQPPPREVPSGPQSSPIAPKHQRRARKRVKGLGLAPLFPPSVSPSHSSAPARISKFRRQYHAPPPFGQGLSFPTIQAPSPSPSLAIPSGPKEWSSLSPTTSSSRSFPGKPKAASPPTVWSLPPPPPNLDCKFLECSEPLTNPPPGSPCVCVWPIKVKLRLYTTVYSFFPLVSEFAQEIASGTAMKLSQVRIMGANVDSEQPEDTMVLVHLVPLAEKFDYMTAFSAYEKFWNKQILIKSELFRNYDVLYLVYPGLPPSPPAAPLNINLGDGTYDNSSNSRAIKPLGVDVRRQKEKTNNSMIIIAVLLSFVLFILCIGAAWLLMLRHRDHSPLSTIAAHRMLPLFSKSSGTRHVMLANWPSSASTSVSSSLATYNGYSKTFIFAEIERATDNFANSRIIGEGGFGLVYRGMLEDGIQVAVKVLKRDDLQGEREFMAEVEMLSRLHHRNLVKLIGICTDDRARCLVYELIPNGSVESHLHGKDKETSPLDWNARLKIALGAARGLAYLHEDSSPPVIHRDFKCSNILLEHDYTPRVSDFGLARAAQDEGNGHISTRVMGTFGYVAPEYAMTGHLLVKSDVYSYGVVLLELLTGRKPVDMSRPPGQENLVSWARPLLTSLEGGLEAIIDKAIQADVEASEDSISKVAALASMCVQPEVTHRPFMGEVVQALKLVCNERDDGDDDRNRGSLKDLTNSGKRINLMSTLEAERALLASDVFGTTKTPLEYATEDFRLQHRYNSSSGPLRTGGRRSNMHNWQRLRSFSTGSSMSDNAIASLTTKQTSSDSREWR